MVVRRIYLIVGAFALCVGLLAGIVVLRDRSHDAAGATETPATRTAAQASGRPSAVPATAVTEAAPVKQTPSRADTAAAARAGWPYSPEVGGTPNLASALNRHMQQVGKTRQTATTATTTDPAARTASAGTGTVAAAGEKPSTAAVDPGKAPTLTPVQRPHTEITAEFYRPKPPPRKQMPQGGGWPERQRQPTDGDG